MKRYDQTNKTRLELMRSRIDSTDDYKTAPSSVHGEQHLRHRQMDMNQFERMVRDRKKSFDRAILYSYQASLVTKYGLDGAPIYHALINSIKTRLNFDEKILSVDFSAGYKVGDIITWIDNTSPDHNDTQWLIYRQDLSERAYFKANISRCSFYIETKDDDGHTRRIYITFSGPSEKEIESLNKHGLSIDVPNYTITLSTANTPENREVFKRYGKFYLQGDPTHTCWRVEGTDWLSDPGILTIHATEYYANATEDDIEGGIVGALIPQKHESISEIQGNTFIKPKVSYVYSYDGDIEAEWNFDSNLPIDCQINGKEIIIKWTANYRGQFTLSYGPIIKTIVVESLF